VFIATMTSTPRRTSSAARPGRRSGFASANRYSIRMFFPSRWPSSRSDCRNASSEGEGSAEPPESTPIRAILVGCAPAASGAVKRPKARPRPARRLMLTTLSTWSYLPSHFPFCFAVEYRLFVRGKRCGHAVWQHRPQLHRANDPSHSLTGVNSGVYMSVSGRRVLSTPSSRSVSCMNFIASRSMRPSVESSGRISS
jgi:hypothetical protein